MISQTLFIWTHCIAILTLNPSTFHMFRFDMFFNVGLNPRHVVADNTLINPSPFLNPATR